MEREASGTSWQPERARMAGLHFMTGRWAFMVHGFVTADCMWAQSPRGQDECFSTSMAMAQSSRDASPGRFGLRAMLSLEPTLGKTGYPLLLQTGETADGRSHLIDRQHPHDLFMELAATYSLQIGPRASTFVYLAWPGEPALGPPAFMHRASAVDNPLAPIGHHWLDSTHITFGVATVGVTAGRFKLEGSAFTGREPDAERWGLDKPRFDSGSARLSWNPTSELAVQVSYGDIQGPEQLAPTIDVQRVTASVSLSRPALGGTLHTTFAWGRNERSRGLTSANPYYARYGPSKVAHAVLLESTLASGRHTTFLRAERVQKDELFQPPDPFRVRVFPLATLTLGHVYDFVLPASLRAGLGASFTLASLPEELDGDYGRRPRSVLVFGRLTFQ
jgi:hypothetical protein